MGKFSSDKRDIYYRMAKVDGYRARSAYKLIQINEKFNIFEGVGRCVDLCSAPGSWTQVLHRFLQKTDEDNNQIKIISVDLQAMAPIGGVIQIQGDITSLETAHQIIGHFDGSTADLVVCDGAPDVTGLHDIDTYIQSQLLLSAINITTHILKTGGTFVAKIFKGKDISLLWTQLKIFFKEVIITKPRSSRNSSIEAFAVCRQYCPPEDYKPVLFNTFLNKKCDQYFNEQNNGSNRYITPFTVCGDLSAFDSDSSHNLDLSSDYSYSYLSQIEPYYKVEQQLKTSSDSKETTLQQKCS